jgi:predicted ATP-dependent serine protease
MARYQRDSKSDEVSAADWELRAERADDGLVWRCTECGHTATEWLALCPGCDGFDTFRWQGVAEIIEAQPVSPLASAPASAAGSGQGEILNVSPNPSTHAAPHG